MEMLFELLIGYLREYPWFGTVVVVLGVMRAIMKPLFSVVNSWVNATPWQEDNKWWASVQASKGMEIFLYLLDWTTSIKIVPKKE